MKKHNIATRFLSVLLAAVMLASTFSFTAFAAVEDEVPGNETPAVTETETSGEEVPAEEPEEEPAKKEETPAEAASPEEPEEEPADEEETPAAKTPAEKPEEETAEEKETPAEAAPAGETKEEAPAEETVPVYATLEDFDAACAAMGDADDMESIQAVLANIKEVYNDLSDEDKAAVADQWAYIQGYAASFSAGNPDTGIEILASGYTPVANVGIYPDREPAGSTANGKLRESGQSLTMKVGQHASFLLGAPTNTLVGANCGHTLAVYNPSDYCYISLVDNSGQNLVGNPTYAAGTNNGARVFDTIFEALKPGTSSDVRVCYYANFGIVLANGADSAYVVCSRCGRSCLVNKDVKWYLYSDVFGITVNADYRLDFNENADGDTVTDMPQPITRTVAKTSCTFSGLSTPVRDGYTFKGWAEAADGSVKYNAGDPVTLNWSDGYGSEANPVSKTLYAVWEEESDPDDPDDETYTVTYTDGVNGVTVFPDQSYEGRKAGDETPEFKGTPVREGYTFMGWAPTVNPVVSDDDADECNEIIYTATWQRETAPGPEPEQPDDPTPDKVTITVNFVDEGGHIVGTEIQEVDRDSEYDVTEQTEQIPEGYVSNGSPTGDPVTGTADKDKVIIVPVKTSGEDPEDPTDPGEDPENPENPDDPTPTPTPTTPPVPVPGTTDPDDPTPPTAVPVIPAPAAPTEELPAAGTPLAPAAVQPAALASAGADDLGEEEIPLAGLGSAAWALLNLILTVCTGLASILLLIGYLGKKEKELKDDEGKTVLGADGKPVYEWTKERKGGLRLFSILPVVTAIVMFLLTEDMRLPMIIVDRWTIVMALIAVMQLCVCVLARKKKEDQDSAHTYGARA